MAGAGAVTGLTGAGAGRVGRGRGSYRVDRCRCTALGNRQNLQVAKKKMSWSPGGSLVLGIARDTSWSGVGLGGRRVVGWRVVGWRVGGGRGKVGGARRVEKVGGEGGAKKIENKGE